MPILTKTPTAYRTEISKPCCDLFTALVKVHRGHPIFFVGNENGNVKFRFCPFCGEKIETD